MNPEQLSTGESAIYDRQLRLWGSSAQMRIKSAKVAVIGLTTSTVEIVKNLILAGASLLLQDDRAVTAETTNFLIQLEVDDTSNLTVSEATAIAAHRLNEHPSVEAKKSAISSAVSAIVVSFRYIGFNVDEAVRLSSLARSNGSAFFLIIDTVTICWSFSDFGKMHVVEDYTAPLKRDVNTGTRESSVHQTEETEFVTLSEYIGSEVGVNKKFLQFFQVLNCFKNGFEDTNSCLAHFGAIQGALVSQEIIKYVTKRDPPLVNTLLINQEDCSCVVWKHPASLQKRIVKTGESDEVEIVVTEEEL